MATSRTCPHCGRWHTVTMACDLAEIVETLGHARGQRAADAAETAAILRYLGLSVRGEEDAG
jgi:hypothetical protein